MSRKSRIVYLYRCLSQMFSGFYLPPDIHKVLYLDCDLLVCGSIAELWNTDLDGSAIGAVEDMWSGKQEKYSRLCYPKKHSYFNSGVLLINLDYFRWNDIGRAIAEYIAKYPERLKFIDQDVLNAVLYSHKKLLPMRWNMQDGFFRKKLKLRPEAISALDEEMPKTVILHFTGPKKPWFDTCRHPYKKMYFKYLDLTKWKGERPQVNYMARLNDFFLSIQGLMGLKNLYRKPRFGIN